MIRVAIVEDEEKEISVIREGLNKYFTETGTEYNVEVFCDGMSFLDARRNNFDIILMDIEMPLLDGIETCRRLREKDDASEIIFVTNMSKYAIKGYEVDVIGFLVKPVGYFTLKTYLNKAVARLSARGGVNITVSTRSGVRVIPSDSLVYVEVMRHNILYHTIKEVITVRGA